LNLSLSPALAILFVALFAMACTAPLTATVDHDPGFDFSRVRTIAIQPIDRTRVSTATISDMQVARIDQALTAELVRRGYQIVEDNGEADLLLAWHLVVEERLDVRSYDTVSAGYTTCWHCGPGPSTDIRVTQYAQGTLIVDLIDPVRLKSVWRSTVASRLRSQDDPEAAAELRTEAAAALFADFPP
jgi:hypothetical protein